MTEQTIKFLKSINDPSVNAVFPSGFETRYVSRNEGKEVIIYLSSHRGCDRACRMCHLTQTGQTDMTEACLEDFIVQAYTSLEQAMISLKERSVTPEVVHFNFMARGEPLMSSVIMNQWTELSSMLIDQVKECFGEIPVKFKISTIMSGFFNEDSVDLYTTGVTNLPFKENKPEIYYSLYSMNPDFRKRWLPKADSPMEALRILGNYQRDGGLVRIHSAFILGHNDVYDEIRMMLPTIKHFLPISPKFNIVRYNPFDEKSCETDQDMLDSIVELISSRGFEVQVVERVGNDIHASCGQFYSEQQ